MASFYTPQDPVICVMATPGATAACQRNGLNPAQLLAPFADSASRGIDSSPIVLRTAGVGRSLSLPSFRVRFIASTDLACLPVDAMDPMLSHALASSAAACLPSISPGGSLYDVAGRCSLSSDGAAAQRLSADLNPWIKAAFAVQAEHLRCIPAEQFQAPVIFLILASTSDLNPIAAMTDATSTAALPRPFRAEHYDAEIPRVYLLLDDLKSETGRLEPAAVLKEMKSSFGPNACFVSSLNSNPDPVGADIYPEPELRSSGLEPEPPRGRWVSSDDLLELRSVLRSVILQVVLPCVESKLISLTSTVAGAKKGIRDVVRSWWTSTPTEATSTPTDTPADVTTVAFPVGCPEWATRTLADLSFQVGDYETAAGLYRRLRDELKPERSPSHWAAAAEMAVIASLSAPGSSPTREDAQALDAAAMAYYKSATAAVSSSGATAAVAAISAAVSPSGPAAVRVGASATVSKRLAIRCATRATVAAAALLTAIPGPSAAVSSRCREASTMLRRCASSEGDSTLTGAVLLDVSASACFKSNPPAFRRAAYLLSLAGNGYAAAGSSRLAARALALAHSCFSTSTGAWPAVSDGLSLALAGQLRTGGDLNTACRLMADVLASGAKRLPVAAQRSLLSDFIATHVRSSTSTAVQVGLPAVLDSTWTVVSYGNAAAATLAVSATVAQIVTAAPHVAQACNAYARLEPLDLTCGLSMPVAPVSPRDAGVGPWPTADVSAPLPLAGRDWHLYEGGCICEGSPVAANVHHRVWSRMDAVTATYSRIRDKCGVKAMASDGWDWAGYVKDVAVADEAAGVAVGDQDGEEEDVDAFHPDAVRVRPGGPEAVSHIHDRRMFEPLTVAVTVTNPLAIPLPITHMRLHGVWMDDAGEKEVQVEVEAVSPPSNAFAGVWPTSTVDLNQAGVECIPVATTLAPLERRTLTLHARIVGGAGRTLSLRTLTWRIAGVVQCSHAVSLLGAPLNDTRVHRATGARSRDLRTLQRIQPATDWCHATLTLDETVAEGGSVRDGQVCDATLRVTNVGATGVTALWLHWDGNGHTFLTVIDARNGSALPTDGVVCDVIPLPVAAAVGADGTTLTLPPGATGEWRARLKFSGVGRLTLRLQLKYSGRAECATVEWPHAAPTSLTAPRCVRWTGHWVASPVVATCISAAPSHVDAGEYALTLRVCSHPATVPPVALDAVVALSDHWRVAVSDATVVAATVSLERHHVDWSTRPLAMHETALLRMRAFHDPTSTGVISSHPTLASPFALALDGATGALLTCQAAHVDYTSLYNVERSRERSRVRAAAAADTLPPTLRSIARDRAAASRSGGSSSSCRSLRNAFATGRANVSIALLWHYFNDETAAATGGVAGRAAPIVGYSLLHRVDTSTGISVAADGLEPHAHTTPATCSLPAPRPPLPFPLLLSIHAPSHTTLPADGGAALVPATVTVYFPGDASHATCSVDVAFETPHGRGHVNDVPDAAGCMWMGPRVRTISGMAAGDTVNLKACMAVPVAGVWNIGGCVRLRPRNASGAYAGVVISGAPTLIVVQEAEDAGMDEHVVRQRMPSGGDGEGVTVEGT